MKVRMMVLLLLMVFLSGNLYAVGKYPGGIICPDGFKYSAENQICYSKDIKQCPEGFKLKDGKCISEPKCEQGYFKNGLCVLSGSKLCPEGTKYYEGKCVKEKNVCPDGYWFSKYSGGCFKKFECPKGSKFDKELNACVIEATFKCPDGFLFDSKTGECYKKAYNSCPSGTDLVDVDGKAYCVSLPVCKTGEYDRESGRCVQEANTECYSEGYKFDFVTDTCYKAPKCPENTTFDPYRNVCYAPVYKVCPFGTVDDKELCVSTPKCPNGFSYDVETDLCKMPLDKKANLNYWDVSIRGKYFVAKPKCLAGKLNPDKDRCEEEAYISCPADTTFNPDTNLCEQTEVCIGEGKYTDTTERCEYVKPNEQLCKDGFIYDTNLNKCVAMPSCNIGFFEEKYKSCMITAMNSCDNTNFSFTNPEKCGVQKADVVCKEGFEFRDGKCVKPAPKLTKKGFVKVEPLGVEGMRYDKRLKKYVTEPSCPQGWVKKYGKCYKYYECKNGYLKGNYCIYPDNKVKVGCPEGSILDESLGMCLVEPECEKGKRFIGGKCL